MNPLFHLTQTFLKTSLRFPNERQKLRTLHSPPLPPFPHLAQVSDVCGGNLQGKERGKKELQLPTCRRRLCFLHGSPAWGIFIAVLFLSIEEMPCRLNLPFVSISLPLPPFYYCFPRENMGETVDMNQFPPGVL